MSGTDSGNTYIRQNDLFDYQDEVVVAREGQETADDCLTCHKNTQLISLCVISVRSKTLNTLCPGTAIYPLKIWSNRQSTYPNILSISVGAECRRMTHCDNKVDENMSRGKRRY